MEAVKKAAVTIFAIAAVCVPLYAGSLSLDAHEIGTDDSYRSNWETDWGSYDREYHRGKRILVTVRDFSRKVPACDISVYFIAHPMFNPSIHFIYDRKEFSPQFRGRIEVVGPVDAGELKARVLNLAALGERYGSGADLDGWIVIGKFNGRVFDVRASNQTLLEIAQTNPRQSQTLTQMVAEYEKADRHLRR
jgi:hypothetical protein